MKNSKNKKKKSKTVYVDDGSTIVDMSAFKSSGERNAYRGRRSTFKEQFDTYINAVKMMFFPMLAVLGIIAVAFLLLYFML